MTEQEVISRDFKKGLRRQNLRWENEVSEILQSLGNIKSYIRYQTIIISLGFVTAFIAVLLK